MAERYSTATARRIAERLLDKYGSQLRNVEDTQGVPAHWLAGLAGMETRRDPQTFIPYEWPDKRSTRFETHVFAALKRVRDSGALARRTYNRVTRADLRPDGVPLSDAALYALASSWGQTQIMGYWVLVAESGLLGVTIANLRDPQQHFHYAARFMLADARMKAQVGRGRRGDLGTEQGALMQVAHIWNSGQAWNGSNAGIKTHSPYYMGNVVLVANLTKMLMTQQRAAEEHVAHTRAFISEPPLTNAPPDTSPGLRDDPDDILGLNEPDAPTDLPPPLLDDPITDALRGLDPMEEAREGAGELHDIAAELREEAAAQQTEESMSTRYDDRILGEGATEGLPATVEEGQNPILDILKPGHKTSEGQLTILFTLISAVATAFGYYRLTPETMQNTLSAILGIVTTVGPLITAALGLWNYTTSRGKLKSNAVRAAGMVQTAEAAPEALTGVATAFGWQDALKIGGAVAGQVVPGAAGGAINAAIEAATGSGGGSRKLTDDQIIRGFENIGGQLKDIKASINELSRRNAGGR